MKLAVITLSLQLELERVDHTCDNCTLVVGLLCTIYLV